MKLTTIRICGWSLTIFFILLFWFFEGLFLSFWAHLIKDLFKQGRIFKPATIIFIKGREMWHLILKIKTNKPTITNIYLESFNGSTHTLDTKKILDDRYFDEENRIKTRTTMIRIIPVFYQIIDKLKLNILIIYRKRWSLVTKSSTA